MNNIKTYLDELSELDDPLLLIRAVFMWLRPDDVSKHHTVVEKVEQLKCAMENNPKQAARIRENVQTLVIDLRFLPLYSDTGILPRRNFAEEFWRRVYDKLMPKPLVIFSAKNLLERIFDRRYDPLWVQAVPDETWLKLYRIFITEEPNRQVETHLLREVLYALEMLSIWLAAEEMEDELLRLDPSIAAYDSNFIAQERELSLFVTAYRSRFISTIETESADASHAWVMLQQCERQIKKFRQLALNKGSDLKLTYLLERLEQILARIHVLLAIVDEPDQAKFETNCIALFRHLVVKQSTERSIISLIRQTNYLLAKSITNHASRTGEHYVTATRREYMSMLKRGLGAGVFIAVMALIKIRLEYLGWSEGWTALSVSLNYGLGFVIIYMFHFTVATKQPAMTAAYIAEQLEYTHSGSVAKKDLAQLMLMVGRSQFAAILGNVAAALPVALLLGFMADAIFNETVMQLDKAAALMHEQNPVTSLALFYAAIAGFWLFVSGLVSGYFDNRCLYLDLPGRIRHHPVLQRIMTSRLRHRLADYIGNHYGSLFGNFFFGVMLGVTGYIGYLLGLPLDIRHVAFSVANVGLSSTVSWPGIWIFLEFVGFALLIGVVNLTVSFILALHVAMRARGIRFGSIRAIVAAYWQEIYARPWEVLLPPKAASSPRQ